MSEPIVDVRNLSVKFGDFYAVKHISFAVNAGEIFGFLGANGAGKPPRFACCAACFRPQRARLLLTGLNLLPEKKI